MKYKRGNYKSGLRIAKPNVVLTLVIAAVTVGIGWAAFQKPPASDHPLSKSVPSGALLYLEARDFSSLLSDWSRSAEKRRMAREQQLPGLFAVPSAAAFA